MKSLIKKILLKGGVFKFAGKLVRPSVVILRYHSVQEDPEYFANTIGTGIIHSKAVFKEQMELIAQRFNPVTLNDILLCIKGEKRIPRKAVAVTFDDGFADNYEIAAPILNHYRIQAAFFITVNSIETGNPPWFYRLRHAFFSTRKQKWLDSEKGKIWGMGNHEEKNAAFLSACEQYAKLADHFQEEVVKAIERSLDVEPSSSENGPMMNWKQIRELHQTGHIIGSHTLSHPNLACVGEKDLHRELTVSKQILENKLGATVIHFSYPSPILQPHWTEKTVEASRQAGYKTAVTCTSGPVRVGTNPLSLNRIWVPKDRNEFLWNLECTLLGRIM